ncbi:MAG: hypothetical protein J3K34DRAFT_144991 [Monoraphidium minutum]|nr:MAG: hypothetical protein J3K34DRAFT_144991 [Monoraphidium minutum]
MGRARCTLCAAPTLPLPAVQARTPPSPGPLPSAPSSPSTVPPWATSDPIPRVADQHRAKDGDTALPANQRLWLVGAERGYSKAAKKRPLAALFWRTDLGAAAPAACWPTGQPSTFQALPCLQTALPCLLHVAAPPCLLSICALQPLRALQPLPAAHAAAAPCSARVQLLLPSRGGDRAFFPMLATCQTRLQLPPSQAPLECYPIPLFTGARPSGAPAAARLPAPRARPRLLPAID